MSLLFAMPDATRELQVRFQFSPPPEMLGLASTLRHFLLRARANSVERKFYAFIAIAVVFTRTIDPV